VKLKEITYGRRDENMSESLGVFCVLVTVTVICGIVGFALWCWQVGLIVVGSSSRKLERCSSLSCGNKVG
jgi:hypothetical protein